MKLQMAGDGVHTPPVREGEPPLVTGVAPSDTV